MEQIEKTQEDFFLALKKIQEEVVGMYLNESNSWGKNERLLNDITSDIICGIMSLLDGYYDENVQLGIVDKKSGMPLQTRIELHDKCVDYLK